MIIKTADDRQPDIAELEALLGRPDVDVHQRKAIEAEIRSIRGRRESSRPRRFAEGVRINEYGEWFRYG